MDFPSDIDGYIQRSIEYSLGLPVPDKTLQMKLLASEAARNRLQGEIFRLQDRLNEKDRKIQKWQAEAALNAQALKKHIEENENLRAECSDLLCRCDKLEKECSLYDRDREVLMEFGNEADERAKDAEMRALEAEENSTKVTAELEHCKHECLMMKERELKAIEELRSLRQRIAKLECARPSLAENDGLACSQCCSLKAENQELQPQLLSDVHFWPEGSQALAAEVLVLREDKEQLRINLRRAEEEAKLLFEQNVLLEKDNKELLKQCNGERQLQASGGKSVGSISSNGKRKSRTRTASLVDKATDCSGNDSPRQPLSPLPQNSPESRMHKK